MYNIAFIISGGNKGAVDCFKWLIQREVNRNYQKKLIIFKAKPFLLIMNLPFIFLQLSKGGDMLRYVYKDMCHIEQGHLYSIFNKLKSCNYVSKCY